MNQHMYHTDEASKNDYLHFTDYRPVLREILMNASTPLTMAVYGQWGSGKTTLLRMLRHDIDLSSHVETRTVWFTAWKYDRCEALWRAFILRVLDALYPRMQGDEEWELRDRVPTEVLSSRQKELVNILQRLEESVYHPVNWEEVGRLTVDMPKLLLNAGKGVAKIGASLLPPFAMAKAAIDLWGEDAGAGENLREALSAIKREVSTQHFDQMTSMEQFEHTFRKALHLALGKNGRLIVLIDDLDRCLPEKAVEVLEAIKLFLEVDGTAFVLGMDKEIIERGIELRYRGHLSTSPGIIPVKGEEYLQKIIQIPFYLPPIAEEDIQNFIEQLEERPAEQVLITEEIMSGLVRERTLSSTTRKVFARGLLPNPRQVKRALNIYRLLQGIALVRECRGSLPAQSVSWPLLAKTVLIQVQFPDLYKEWRREPRLVSWLEEELSQRHSGIDADVSTPTTSSDPFKKKLMAPFLDQDWANYSLLENILAYNPGSSSLNAREGVRFGDLSLEQLQVYVRLAGSLALEGVKVKELGPVWDELVSGERERVCAATEHLLLDDNSERRVRAQWLLARRLSGTSGSPAQRASWAEALVQLGRPELAIPALEREISTDDQVVRRQAVECLVQLRHPSAVNPLVEWTQDPQEDVRRFAFRSLMLIKDLALESLVLKLRDTSAPFRAELALAMGELRDARAISVLAECLYDKRADVRRSAAHSLGILKAVNVADKLAALLDDELDVQKAVAEALLTIGVVKPLVEFLDGLDIRSSNLFRFLISVSDLAVPSLVGYLRQESIEDRDREATIAILVEFGDAAVPLLVSCLEQRNKSVQLAAIDALGQIGDPRAKNDLTGMLSFNDDEIKVAVIRALNRVDPVTSDIHRKVREPGGKRKGQRRALRRS